MALFGAFLDLCECFGTRWVRQHLRKRERHGAIVQIQNTLADVPDLWGAEIVAGISECKGDPFGLSFDGIRLQRYARMRRTTGNEFFGELDALKLPDPQPNGLY